MTAAGPCGRCPFWTRNVTHSSGMTCFAWNNANAYNASLGRRNFEAAGALGIMCIATGILYFLDFFHVVYQREVIKREEEDEYGY